MTTSTDDAPNALRRHLRWVAAVLGLAAILTCAALSTHDPLSLVPKGGAAYSGHVPTPDAAQEAALRQDYRAVAGRLDDANLVPAARALCRDILGGSTEAYLIESTQVRHTSPHTKGLTDDQARQVINAVKNNGFCRA